MRDDQGKFLPKPDPERLGKVFSVRFLESLEGGLLDLAQRSGLKETEYVRAVVHDAIRSNTTIRSNTVITSSPQEQFLSKD